jgi:hypothetical protein
MKTPTHSAPPPAVEIPDPIRQQLRTYLMEQRRAALLMVDSAERGLRELGWEPGGNGRRPRRGRISGDTKEGNGG